MSRRVFCDWGGSRLRAYLEVCGTIVASRDGLGIGVLNGTTPLAEILNVLTAWTASGELDSVVLCGMVGSRNGLTEVPYLVAPIGVDRWAAHAFELLHGELRLTIAPGVRALNYSCTQDVMRGEETQVFGTLTDHPYLMEGPQLLLLPGTHSKWVEIEDGTITRIQSFITGELFAILRDHSSLLRVGAMQEDPGAGFSTGIERAARGGIGEALFETRTAQLILNRSCGWAEGFLSGLLIGDEVGTVLRMAGRPKGVTIIGDPSLVGLYRKALMFHNIDATPVDGEQSAIAGLRLLDARTVQAA